MKLHSDTQRRVNRVRRTVAVLLGVGVIAAAIWWLRPFVGGFVDSIVDRAGDQVRVVPVDVKASSSTKGHRAAATVDGVSTTYWQPAAAGEAAGESLTYTFEDPFRLVAVLMIPGASMEQDEFLQRGRPAEVLVVMTTADGEKVERTWTLDDQAGEQALSVGVDEVRRVRLIVKSAHGTEDGQRLALAEVEFFTRG